MLARKAKVFPSKSERAHASAGQAQSSLQRRPGIGPSQRPALLGAASGVRKENTTPTNGFTPITKPDSVVSETLPYQFSSLFFSSAERSCSGLSES